MKIGRILYIVLSFPVRSDIWAGSLPRNFYKMATAGIPFFERQVDLNPVRDRGMDAHGHTFVKKTFHKPTFCHHCTDMLWGFIGQGYICEGTYV